MAKMTVEMNADEVKQAVIEWAEKHHGMKVRSVDYSASMEWRGHGMAEKQMPVPKVSFEAQ